MKEGFAELLLWMLRWFITVRQENIAPFRLADMILGSGYGLMAGLSMGLLRRKFIGVFGWSCMSPSNRSTTFDHNRNTFGVEYSIRSLTAWTIFTNLLKMY